LPAKIKDGFDLKADGGYFIAHHLFIEQALNTFQILRIKKFLILKFGISEVGERHRKGVKLFNGVLSSEKVYQSFLLEIKTTEGIACSRLRATRFISFLRDSNISRNLIFLLNLRK
jgi:hypothetical protein